MPRTPGKITALSALLAAGLAAGLALSGCSLAEPAPSPTSSSKPTPDASAPTSKPGESAESGDGTVDMAAALAERDRFISDQGLPLDGSLLTAQTDPQRAFIAAERAFVESQGGAWSAEAESTYLALAMDACETSILQGHRVTTDTFTVHVGTSPLFAALIPEQVTGEERRVGERNTAAKMVAGVSYVCEADLAQWVAAYDEVYPPAAQGETPLGG